VKRVILVDYEIAELCDSKEPLIHPFTTQEYLHGISHGLGPSSYDVRIDKRILVAEKGKEPGYYHDVIGPLGFLVWPGMFILASTIETIIMPKGISATVRDKSTHARLGLAVQNTFIDPGFRGQVTLEISNHAPFPVRIYPEIGICQLVFDTHKNAAMPYKGKYQNQKGVTKPC
jgi:dCTP deaminase